MVNYVAAYQWSDGDQQWHLVEDSSFNTDGRYGAFDLIKPDGGLGEDAWMQPQPGGELPLYLHLATFLYA